jgi:hypothetical protein
MVTPAGGIASPFFPPLRVIAPPRLVGCRADVPTCGLTCLDSGLRGPHPPSAQSPPLCGHASPHVNVDRRASAPLEDGVA